MSPGDREPYTERRRAPRIQIPEKFRARLLTGKATVRLHDLGVGGFSLVSDVPFRVGDVHRFAIISGPGRLVEVTARAAYSRPLVVPRDKDQYFTGFAFTALSADAREAVNRILDQLTSALSFE
ncbi:MAG TPA: PilZ domain-containing protein [Vicinamibacterales bacterium]|nr:PilZ domain-containing protein [Vicinamibacterales bacterium]